MTDRFSRWASFVLVVVLALVLGAIVWLLWPYPSYAGILILIVALLAWLTKDLAPTKALHGLLCRALRRWFNPGYVRPHFALRAKMGIEPFAFLIEVPPDPVWGAERRVRTDLFDERQDIRHLEVRVAVPKVVEREREKTREFENAPADIAAQANRCATVDIIRRQHEPVVQVVLWASGLVHVAERPEEGEPKKHPALFNKGELDLSQWVTVTIDWFGEQGRVIINGDESCAQTLSLQWPSHVQVHLSAVSWTVAPVAAFSQPEAW